jgi:phosphatidylglycerophosphate synthase
MDMYLLKFPYRKILKPLAVKLAWIHPDVFSYAAVFVAAITGWCFFEAVSTPILLIIAIILIFLRMTLNTIDGVIAIHRGHLSLKGEVVNALPDRYSDIFLVGGITLSPLCRDWLGIAALATIFLVSYTGMLGKALTVDWQHQGPMGKVERLSLIMVFALIQFFVLPEKQTVTWIGIIATPMEWAMGIIITLGQYTVFRRLTGQLKQMRCKEAEGNTIPQLNSRRAIVIYDSATSNTEKVARKIAEGLCCSAMRVSEINDITGFELVVLGSPNIRKKATHKMLDFQKSIQDRPTTLALFTTFGMPIWGHLTAPSCIKSMANQWNMQPIATLKCPGFHTKYKTYKNRPGKEDLLTAFLFGIKLSKKLKAEHDAKATG